LCEVLYEEKFLSVGNGEWWDEMKYGKKLKIGDAMAPQEISKRYKRQSLGMPRGTPSSSVKIRSSFKTLYFYCFVFYAFFLERIYFRFQFYFVLLDIINGWTPTNFFWRRCTPFFIAKNTLVFTLIVQRVFFFSSTAFSFRFLPWFLFISCYFFVSRCIYTSGVCWFSSLRVDSKRLNGVGKEKKVSWL
jgi:hypothetical protein